MKKLFVTKGKKQILIFSLTILFSCFFAQSSQAQNILFKLESEINHLINHSKFFVVSIVSHSSYFNLPEAETNSGKKDKSRDKIVAAKHIGSGLIYNRDGFIITKESVIEDADSIEVVLYDGRECDAQLIEIDAVNEVAVLKIEISNLATPHFADDASPPIGSWVLVLGNSLGVSPTASLGFIRRILANGLVQISANISPGAIGSPVFNLKGEVLGIVAARLSPETQNKEQFLTAGGTSGGIVYLIPSLKPNIEQSIDNYKHPKGWLGVTASKVQNAHAGSRVDITKVFKNSPADSVDLRVGDTILKLNQIEVKNLHDLVEKIRNYRPSEEIEVELSRNGKPINKRVILGQPPTFLSPLRSRFTPSSPTLPTRRRRFFSSDQRKVPLEPTLRNRQLEQQLQQLETEIRQIKKTMRKRK